MKQKFLRIVSKVSMFLTASTLVFSAVAPMAAHAAALKEAMIILSDVTVSASANITIQFEAQTAINASGDAIIVTFPAAWGDFGVGFGPAVDFDLETKAAACSPTAAWTADASKTLAAAAAGGTWGVSTTTTAVTFTAPTDAGATEIAAGDCVRIEIGTNATTGGTGDSQLTNPSTNVSHLVAITGTNWGDSGDVAVGLVTDGTMAVTGDVDPSITFEVGVGATATTLCTAGSTESGVALTIPTIGTSTVNRDGYICTRVNTNATDGASVFMDSLNGQLKSTSVAADTIPDAAQSSVTAFGSQTGISRTAEAYKACVSEESGGTGKTSGGTLTIDTEFDGVATTCQGPTAGGVNYTTDDTLKGGEISTSNEQIWSVNGPVTDAFANLIIMTAITAETEAHDDYSDTLTFTAVATF